MAESLEAEGVVLLRNENGALPLAGGSKVNLFGFGSIDPIYGGTGSGSGDTSADVDVVRGLQNAGLVVNEELVKFYQSAGVERAKQGGYTGSNFTPAEVPASAYTDAVLQQAKDFSTVCHPSVEAGGEAPAAAASVSPEDGMELYDLADFWLGCHVNIKADGSYEVAYDFGGENNGIVEDTGKWERVSDTELKLVSDGGAEIPVTLADGKWSCEVTEPNTSTVCHPGIEAGGGGESAAAPEAISYMIVYTDADGNVYNAVETTDTSVVPETENPQRRAISSPAGRPVPRSRRPI